MSAFSQLISKFIPDGFSPEAQEIITAMVLESYTESKDLGKQVEATIKQFEAEYPALAICPRCEGCGCNYCDFDGLYNPDDKEPDGTN
ncbi:hypothetical protein [Tychonema sp. LEGE 07203]|uniref:hypothetical protein n=1 Tax=Tychonema sp. LEGE 07203 TaxID=1828671 RepID=UPI00187F49C5|nr:hypothetical protein [Tychonema sp. LEGE 07203]MBE9093291.1 hypothetical protein [Tychonema sp. LEGE 07203]